VAFFCWSAFRGGSICILEIFDFSIGGFVSLALIIKKWHYEIARADEKVHSLPGLFCVESLFK